MSGDRGRVQTITGRRVLRTWAVTMLKLVSLTRAHCHDHACSQGLSDTEVGAWGRAGMCRRDRPAGACRAYIGQFGHTRCTRGAWWMARHSSRCLSDLRG